MGFGAVTAVTVVDDTVLTTMFFLLLVVTRWLAASKSEPCGPPGADHHHGVVLDDLLALFSFTAIMVGMVGTRRQEKEFHTKTTFKRDRKRDPKSRSPDGLPA